ncbi:MAG TPA: TlpA family protein disulfide reductase [Bacteroidaceae bacterium]|nr:TlpA family protein disulfide reductase [Bacteroidaceae bacterium]
MENITSLSSIYALYQKLYEDIYVMNDETDLQYFKFVADSMKAYYPNSSLTKHLFENISLRERQFETQSKMEELLSYAEEKGSLEIVLPDIHGDTVRLSDLKGKVVMLIFWSSRNAQSISSMINLQNIYNKYNHKGFEIYAISLDNNRTQWISAINFNEFKWINVSELSYPDSHADRMYNVTRLPTNFLLNKEGALVTRDIYGRTLEIWLDNLL